LILVEHFKAQTNSARDNPIRDNMKLAVLQTTACEPSPTLAARMAIAAMEIAIET